MATLGEQAVGSIVKLNVDGVATNFIVVHQGLPGSMYDSSCDGTWLLMQDVYDTKVWDTTDNDYKYSTIHDYLNYAFITLFDSDVQNIIKQVKIPYFDGVGATSILATGYNGLSTKVFLLSYAEVDCRDEKYSNEEGMALNYFDGSDYQTKYAYYNGSYCDYWLRTPARPYNNNYSVAMLGDMGVSTSYKVNFVTGVRPAFIMPYNTAVVNGLIDGSTYTPPIAITGNVTIGGVAKSLTGEGYVNIGGIWRPLTRSYANIGGVWKRLYPLDGTEISDFEVGSSVYMNVNGVSTEFLIIQQGRPSTIYDISCDGTWLMMKDVYTMSKFGSSNRYGASTIHKTILPAFINSLDSNIQPIVKTIKIPHWDGFGNHTDVLASGTNGLSTKAFILSNMECYDEDTIIKNATQLDSAIRGDGYMLDYCALNLPLNKAYYQGQATEQWLRTPDHAPNNIWIINNEGYLDSTYDYNFELGVRPVIIVPFTTMVSNKNNNIIV